ncbi:MAG: hypothetical protein AAF628_17505 [Planctomycetota bacterium]
MTENRYRALTITAVITLSAAAAYWATRNVAAGAASPTGGRSAPASIDKTSEAAISGSYLPRTQVGIVQRVIVRDRIGNPIEGAEVHHCDRNARYVARSQALIGTTDRTGALAINDLLDPAKVLAHKSGHYLVEVLINDDPDEIVCVLEKGHALEVYCADAGGAPIEGMLVLASSHPDSMAMRSCTQHGDTVPGLHRETATYRANTDARGLASLQGLPSGDYWILPHSNTRILRKGVPTDTRVPVPGPALHLEFAESHGEVVEFVGDEVLYWDLETDQNQFLRERWVDFHLKFAKKALGARFPNTIRYCDVPDPTVIAQNGGATIRINAYLRDAGWTAHDVTLRPVDSIERAKAIDCAGSPRNGKVGELRLEAPPQYQFLGDWGNLELVGDIGGREVVLAPQINETVRIPVGEYDLRAPKHSSLYEAVAGQTVEVVGDGRTVYNIRFRYPLYPCRIEVLTPCGTNTCLMGYRIMDASGGRCSILKHLVNGPGSLQYLVAGPATIEYSAVGYQGQRMKFKVRDDTPDLQVVPISVSFSSKS